MADNPVGEWNTFRILMTGERVSVWLNGELVTDNVIMENYWNRSIPIFEKGAVELQAHGTDLALQGYIYQGNKVAPNITLHLRKKQQVLSLFSTDAILTVGSAIRSHTR